MLHRLGGGRADYAGEFLAMLQHDQGGPKPHVKAAPQRLALPIFDLQMGDIAAALQCLGNGGLCGLAVRSPGRTKL